jgi:hypothetical protein
MRFGFDVRPDEMERLPPWQREPRPGLRRRRNSPAAEPDDVALATWSIVALLGVALGVALAKYSQAWSRDVLHPGATLGTAMIVISLGLALAAGVRYWAQAVDPLSGRRASRALTVLSALLVISLAWAGLNIVWLAGWALPPDAMRQGR